MAAPNARRVALSCLSLWEETSRHADDILDSVGSRQKDLKPADRSLVQHLFYGVLRHLNAIDYVIDRLRRGRLNREARNLLRLGVCQLYFAEIPPHAAVNETVRLAQRNRGLINAILREALRQKETLLQGLAAEPLWTRLSHPSFVVERWVRNFGEDVALKLCEWNNEIPPVYLRANTLVTGAADTLQASPGLEPLPGSDLFFRLEGPIPQRLLEEGLAYAQDPSTAMACRLLAPAPGDRILDACAAPGGKTTFMAAQMGNRGEIVACDKSERRLRRVTENVNRLQVQGVRNLVHDWTSPAPPEGLAKASCDAILIDAPCSNTGVMRRRVDLRWRLQPGEFERLPALQRQIMEHSLPYLKPGGRLVYSTCSLEPEENTGLVEVFLRDHPEFSLEEEKTSLPWRDGFDGAYAARLVKRA